MIQVQIASQLTASGVDGIRWVLVEVPDSPAAVPTVPAALPAAGPGPVAAGVAAAAVAEVQARPAVPLALLKLAVLGLSAGLALWFAQAWFGPVTASAWSAAQPAQPSQRATPPPAARPMPAAPSADAQQMPAAPPLPASAPVAAPLLIAALN